MDDLPFFFLTAGFIQLVVLAVLFFLIVRVAIALVRFLERDYRRDRSGGSSRRDPPPMKPPQGD